MKHKANGVKNKHGASKIIDTFETYQPLERSVCTLFRLPGLERAQGRRVSAPWRPARLHL
jgi:hypothetical protein